MLDFMKKMVLSGCGFILNLVPKATKSLSETKCFLFL